MPDTLTALTIHQPWAWAIFHGKSVENRTWPTSYRGPLLIHAGKTREWYDREDAADWREWYGVSLPGWDSLPKGAIVGRVTLVDCVRADPNRPFFAPGRGPCPWAEGPWLWVLADPVEFATPVPYRGAQGLFQVPASVLGTSPAKPSEPAGLFSDAGVNQ